MVTVYPTGTTIYDPDRCWNGFTLIAGANLIDMNGNLRQSWDSIRTHAKLIPDGQVLGAAKKPGTLKQLNW